MAQQWNNVSDWASDPIEERWRLVVDLNRDGHFTVTDLGHWLGYLFHAPGDGLITVLQTTFPGLARFLELGVADFGGMFSGFVSAFVWASVLSYAATAIFMLALRLEN